MRESTPGPAPASGDRVVLVIEDDQHLRKFYGVALRGAGYEVVLAGDGREGLEVVARQPVGLVLCDVTMPGMSGFDVVRELRAARETATLPIILVTGSGDANSVLEGLAAGADDFLSKPARLEELVARVHALFRSRSAWTDLIEEELHARARMVSTLGRLRPMDDPEAAAQQVVSELARRSGTAFAAVFQVTSDNRGRMLASTLGQGTELERLAPTPARLARIIDATRRGPWVETLGVPTHDEAASMFWAREPDIVAGAPIFAGEELVGILTMGQVRDPSGRASPRVRDLLLATAIDYAAVLGATIGPTLAARMASQARTRQLSEVLERHELDTAFQPIVDLSTRQIVGYEALTRFRDGAAPATRFAEASAAGLGTEYEVAAVACAGERGLALPRDAFVCLNVSPSVLLGATDRLRAALPTDRPVVIEVTEHAPIDDYDALRAAVRALGGVTLAVDDAGAGYASMRHILELAPAFVKLDMSIVRGIDEDPLRQALAAGLVYYAIRSDFRLIAEGVESEGEAAALDALGVDLAQGFLFGHPKPA
jgi:EAL domain-containing protein (putative c-di-GMP-specific phosphodiesterase class I)/DNA-binding response OmpR family regulator